MMGHRRIAIVLRAEDGDSRNLFKRFGSAETDENGITLETNRTCDDVTGHKLK
jgi:hypothetical protein